MCICLTNLQVKYVLISNLLDGNTDFWWVRLGGGCRKQKGSFCRVDSRPLDLAIGLSTRPSNGNLPFLDQAQRRSNRESPGRKTLWSHRLGEMSAFVYVADQNFCQRHQHLILGADWESARGRQPWLRTCHPDLGVASQAQPRRSRWRARSQGQRSVQPGDRCPQDLSIRFSSPEDDRHHQKEGITRLQCLRQGSSRESRVSLQTGNE